MRIAAKIFHESNVCRSPARIGWLLRLLEVCAGEWGEVPIVINGFLHGLQVRKTIASSRVCLNNKRQEQWVQCALLLDTLMKPMYVVVLWGEGSLLRLLEACTGEWKPGSYGNWRNSSRFACEKTISGLNVLSNFMAIIVVQSQSL